MALGKNFLAAPRFFQLSDGNHRSPAPSPARKRGHPPRAFVSEAGVCLCGCMGREYLIPCHVIVIGIVIVLYCLHMQMHNDVIDFSIVYENLLCSYCSRRIEFLFNFCSIFVRIVSIFAQF